MVFMYQYLIFFRVCVFWPKCFATSLYSVLLITILLVYFVLLCSFGLRSEDNILFLTITVIFNSFWVVWAIFFVVNRAYLTCTSAFVTWYKAENVNALSRSDINAEVDKVLK